MTVESWFSCGYVAESDLNEASLRVRTALMSVSIFAFISGPSLADVTKRTRVFTSVRSRNGTSCFNYLASSQASRGLAAMIV
jgi:hypothetical protein